MKQCQALVREINEISPYFYCLTLEESYLAQTAQPGQFLHLRIGNGIAPLLRRPFSVAGTSPATGMIRLLFRRVGAGTELLSCMSEGDWLDCLGPLGTPFSSVGRDPVVLLAGGAGVAPLLFLGESLLSAGKKVHLFYGAADATALLPVERFLSSGILIHFATEDGSVGEHGKLPDVFKLALNKGLAPGELFACGPLPLLSVLANENQRWGLPMQVSLEENMACGVGACQGCAVLIKEDGETVYKRVCREGPVFNSSEVVW